MFLAGQTLDFHASFLSVNLIKVKATHIPDAVQLYFSFGYKGGYSKSEVKC